ncbi:MAG: PDZ domain-containing protein [Chloroflexi bacterium]|nr:PDZ domain-containing protein [Chloroflexota bacterium]
MKKNRGIVVGVLGAAAILLVACVCVIGLVAVSRAGGPSALSFQAPVPSSTPGTLAIASTPTQGPLATPVQGAALSVIQAQEAVINNVYERVAPSVVNISVVSVPQDGSGLQEGSGSGFVFDTDGDIVTNNHVVQDARSIQVRFSNDLEVSAKVIGTDPDSDLAVIRVDVDPAMLHPVELADSDQLKVGQFVIAIGNPFGFERSVTTGIISALGRLLLRESRFSLPNLIQTDTAINPGNSGGPLLDARGRVIGVTTLIFSQTRSSAGVGMAIPSNAVRRVAPALISKGNFKHSWLGIRGTTLTPALAQTLDLPVKQGALVEEVISSGPSDRAGLRGGTRDVQIEGIGRTVRAGGDVILAIDEQPVRHFDDLIVYLEKTTVGQTVDLTILRDGQEVHLQVKLGARPATVPQQP